MLGKGQTCDKEFNKRGRWDGSRDIAFPAGVWNGAYKWQMEEYCYTLINFASHPILLFIYIYIKMSMTFLFVSFSLKKKILGRKFINGKLMQIKNHMEIQDCICFKTWIHHLWPFSQEIFSQGLLLCHANMWSAAPGMLKGSVVLWST